MVRCVRGVKGVHSNDVGATDIPKPCARSLAGHQQGVHHNRPFHIERRRNVSNASATPIFLRISLHASQQIIRKCPFLQWQGDGSDRLSKHHIRLPRLARNERNRSTVPLDLARLHEQGAVRRRVCHQSARARGQIGRHRFGECEGRRRIPAVHDRLLQRAELCEAGHAQEATGQAQRAPQAIQHVQSTAGRPNVRPNEELPDPAAVRELQGFEMARLDHRSRRLWRLLLQRRVQFPAERAHERHEPCHRADAGPSDAAAESAQAVLCANEAQPHFGAVLSGRDKCEFEEVQEYGGEELRMPLIGVPNCAEIER